MSKKEVLAKIVNGYKPLTIFVKKLILNIWQRRYLKSALPTTKHKFLNLVTAIIPIIYKAFRLICRAHHLIGFIMRGTLTTNGLNQSFFEKITEMKVLENLSFFLEVHKEMCCIILSWNQEEKSARNFEIFFT